MGVGLPFDKDFILQGFSLILQGFSLILQGFSLILQAERCGKDVIFKSSFNDFTLFAVKNGFRLFFEDFSGYFEDFSAFKITAKSLESAEKSF